MASTPDAYLAVKGSEGTLHSTNVASSAEIERLWKASRANDKAGEIVSLCSCCFSCYKLCSLTRRAGELTACSVSSPEQRTFYGVDGKTVVAVSTGKDSVKKGGEAEDNKLKEVTRKTVRSSLFSNAARWALTLLFLQAAIATHALKAAHSKHFQIDPLHSAHSAAVGATLASFDGYQSVSSDINSAQDSAHSVIDYRTTTSRPPPPRPSSSP